jgi:hypothetical protein
MVVDTDKTISKLLLKYYRYIHNLIENEKQNVMKIKDDAEFEKAKAQYLKLVEAESFFKLIVVNPEKYLYRPLNIVFIKIDENNHPVDFSTLNNAETRKLPNICDKVKPIRELINKRNGWHVLDMLSSYISGHVRAKGKKDPWIYNGDKISDYRAYYILELNKYVDLLLTNSFVKMFKNKMPVEYFAEKRIK